MRLSRVATKFSLNSDPLMLWNPVYSQWESTEIRGDLKVHDRFISDREFGQKKRIFLTPGKFELPTTPYPIYMRLPNVDEVWMLESKNFDADVDTYGTVVVFHEASVAVKLIERSGTRKRATGVGYLDLQDVVVSSCWADCSRFSSVESRELGMVDYSIYTWFFPYGTQITRDTIIDCDLGRFIVREVSNFLDLLSVKAQKQDKPHE